MIVAEGLAKRYGAVEAVRGVSFEVGDGEVFGLLGPNGAGKTTVIKMLTTLAVPDRGRAEVCGVDVRRHPVRAKGCIGTVPQATSLDRELSALDNLLVNGRAFGLGRRERRERAEDLLESVGLMERARDSIRGFSGGMLQRLLIVRALMHDPEAVFLDEPTLGLDPQSRRAVWGRIRGMREAGKAVLLTTHYIEEAEELCDRVAIMDRGRIVATGSPEELKRRVPGRERVVATVDRFSPEDEQRLRDAVDVECVGAERGDELVEVVVRLKGGAEALPSVVEALVPAGLHTVALEQPSLEDVFIEITGRELRE